MMEQVTSEIISKLLILVILHTHMMSGNYKEKMADVLKFIAPSWSDCYLPVGLPQTCYVDLEVVYIQLSV